MSRSTLLILGFVAVLLLALLCLTCHGGKIEAGLVAEAEGSLREAGLEWAAVTADGCVLTLTGSAPDAGAREQALDRLRRLPGVCGVGDGTSVPAPTAAVEPYRFAAVRADDGIRLDGTVPDEAARSAVVDRAVSFVGADRVDDRLEIRTPGPDGRWGEAALALLGSLGELTEGQASLVDRHLEVSGIATSTEKAEAARALAGENLPDGYRGSARITAPTETGEVDSATCQRLLVTLMRDNEIRFATSSATIERSSHALLDGLAAAIARCPATRIEVAGHTDSRGAEDYNQELSRRRAAAVRGYLVDRGVSPDRLTAVGYGETRPIGDNATAAGMAQNRRIEFEIQ